MQGGVSLQIWINEQKLNALQLKTLKFVFVGKELYANTIQGLRSPNTSLLYI